MKQNTISHSLEQRNGFNYGIKKNENITLDRESHKNITFGNIFISKGFALIRREYHAKVLHHQGLFIE